LAELFGTKAARVKRAGGDHFELQSEGIFGADCLTVPTPA
jgi:hypothetical protein